MEDVEGERRERERRRGDHGLTALLSVTEAVVEELLGMTCWPILERQMVEDKRFWKKGVLDQLSK